MTGQLPRISCTLENDTAWLGTIAQRSSFFGSTKAIIIMIMYCWSELCINTMIYQYKHGRVNSSLQLCCTNSRRRQRIDAYNMTACKPFGFNVNTSYWPRWYKVCSDGAIATDIFFTNGLHRILEFSHGVITTILLNPIQPINCNFQIAVAIAPCA